jgi:hypothetical protein
MYVQNPVTLYSYLRIFYQPEAGYFLWFIWALWWMFVIVPLFKTKGSRLLLFAASLLAAYVPLGMTDVFCLKECKRFFVYFMLGVIAYENKDVLSRRATIPNWLPVIAFISADFICLLTNRGGHLGILRNIIPYLGIWSILIISSKIEVFIHKKSVNWLLGVAASSYLIYLFHTTFEGFAKAVIQRVPFMNDNGGMFFVLGVCIVVICGVVCPMVLHRCFLNKTKVTRFLFGLK